MNEHQMNVAKLIIKMYELIEENIFDVEKSIEKSISNIFKIDSINEKSLTKSNIEQFINLIIIIKRIKTTYFENEIFQQFMNVKRTNKQTQNIFCILQKKYWIEIESLQNLK